MREQLICSKCGNVNWSQWFQTCECREPDFRFETYDEYVKYIRSKSEEGEV